MSINTETYLKIKKYLIDQRVELIAVSKTKPVDAILEMYNLGQRHFGENRVQELVEKAEKLPKDIKWHAIGHLQRNKVKYIAPFIHLIHSVDSVKLLIEINKEASKSNRVIPVLLQIHIAKEDSKFGLSKIEVIDFLESNVYKRMENIEIQGLMGMATFTNNTEIVTEEFAFLKQLFEFVKQDYFNDDSSFNQLSMGMSGDYELAIKQGSTLVRIGSLLFGKR